MCLINMWINAYILHVKFYNYGLNVNECVPLWNLYTCYFIYTDVDYGGLNPFKQPDKGMDFLLTEQV